MKTRKEMEIKIKIDNIKVALQLGKIDTWELFKQFRDLREAQETIRKEGAA